MLPGRANFVAIQATLGRLSAEPGIEHRNRFLPSPLCTINALVNARPLKFPVKFAAMALKSHLENLGVSGRHVNLNHAVLDLRQAFAFAAKGSQGPRKRCLRRSPKAPKPLYVRGSRLGPV